LKGTLRTRRQFQCVYENGRKAVGDCCVVYAFRPRPEEIATVGDYAFGVVASKKVGNAVRRNRAKRLLREAYRALSSRLERPLWVVLVARRTLADSGMLSEDLIEELHELFARLDLYGADALDLDNGEFPC